MKQIAVDSSMKKLSTEALTLQIGRADSPLASFLLVLNFYGESLGGRGFVMGYKCHWIELMESSLLILEYPTGRGSAEKLEKFGGPYSLATSRTLYFKAMQS